jgi:tetratricopeptide (TPR) repeat protein
MGGGADLGLNYALPGTPLTLDFGIDYSYSPDKASDSLSMAAGRLGVGLQLTFGPSVSVFAKARGGYYYAAMNNNLGSNAMNPYVGGLAGFQFALAPTFRLMVGAQYKYYLGLWQGAGAVLGASIALGNLGGSMDIPTIDLKPAFPVFYKYYDDHPIGKLTIKSGLKVAASDLQARVNIKQFMDAPKTENLPGTLAPGASRDIDLYALFTDKVLSLTEGTKVAAEITISYTIDGRRYESGSVETMSVMGRNAMTWDDNRKAAAFVAAKDPQVLGFSRGITSFVRSKEARAINDKLVAAMALHEALDLYGLNYTPNPVTPYTEASKRTDVIDFLQFPIETLKYRAGDCSDISILYASLLQAAGIDAAFITVPGHIFVAVDTGIAPDKAGSALLPEGMYIVRNGTAWVPVEITMRRAGFLKAWQLGAKEWTENSGAGQAGFWPVKEAWAAYAPVGLPGDEPVIALPALDQVVARYQVEASKYLSEAIGPQVARLQAQTGTSGATGFAAMNSLGVLYAKTGQPDKASELFRKVLASKSYMPAILNMGNLLFTQGDWKGSLQYFNQAAELDPKNDHVLLSLAKANQELQNYDDAKKNYDRLKGLNPGLAAQYAYLGGGGADQGSRATDVATERSSVIWEDD